MWTAGCSAGGESWRSAVAQAAGSIVGAVTARLRIVLDQLVSPTDSDLAAASRSLSQALIETTPSGCEVAGILPASRGSAGDAPGLPDLAEVWRAPVGERELAQAWRWGVPLGASGGMIHSPTLMAPLARHDRVYGHDQTVVTVWSLEAWLTPGRLPRASVAWQRAMLVRAVRHADAVVVPTHAMAAQLADIAPLGARVRVIAGAPEAGFGVTPDAPGRLRTLGLPQSYLVALCSGADVEALAPVFSVAADLDLDVVVIGAEGGGSAALLESAQTAGLAEQRIHATGGSDAADRAAVLAGALAVVAPSTAPVYPWRMLEALAVGAPIVAAASPQHEEVLADAATFVAPGDVDAVSQALHSLIEHESIARRLRVLAVDRSRSFSWCDTAHRVWKLHAEL